MPSRPGDFHPEPLTEPDVSLATHPARATLSAETPWFLLLPVDQTDPDAGGPLPSLHRHYPASTLLWGGPPLKGRFSTFGLAGQPLGPFPFASPLEVLGVPYASPEESHAPYTLRHRRTKR